VGLRVTPFVSDSDFTLYVGDVRDVLAEMPDGSVDCVVTSPPYWGLRDYGTGAWDGGDPDCDHSTARSRGDDIREGDKQGASAGSRPNTQTVCTCGATRVDQQIGLEPTPEAYVEQMVAVFRQVRRVLADHGTCWLNLGDSYASTAPGTRNGSGTGLNAKPEQIVQRADWRESNLAIKAKDLVGIPWRVAFALQQPYYTGRIRDERDRIWLAAVIEAEGCIFIHKRKVGQSNGQGYLRKSDSYGAGLEVSSTDRVIVERCMAITGIGSICEQSPEQNERRKQTIYRWNVRSNECRWIIGELYPHFYAKQHEARLLLGCPSSGDEAAKAHESLKAIHQGDTPTIDFSAPASMFEPGWYLRMDNIWAKKNCMPESVTDRPTKAHEYVFLLSKQPRYFFDQEAVREPHTPDGRKKVIHDHAVNGSHENYANMGTAQERWPNGGRNIRSVWEIATQPYPEAHFATFPEALAERCIKAGCPEGGVVLDPFMGSGTVALVARRLERRSVGIELNEEYARLCARRLQQLSLLSQEVS
jgi:DNA modification methylase